MSLPGAPLSDKALPMSTWCSTVKLLKHCLCLPGDPLSDNQGPVQYKSPTAKMLSAQPQKADKPEYGI